jgi:hypothetical protein
LLYISIIGAVGAELKESKIWIACILVFNCLVLLFTGNYLIRAILFPYSNFFIRKQLDSVINQRFSSEFGRLLQQIHKILRILSEQDGLDTFAEFKKAQADREEAEAKGLVEADSAVPNTSERIVSNISVVPRDGGVFTTGGGGTEERKNEVSLKDKKKITSELNTSKVIVDDYCNYRNAGSL